MNTFEEDEENSDETTEDEKQISKLQQYRVIANKWFETRDMIE